jgi:hypothetical protein
MSGIGIDRDRGIVRQYLFNDVFHCAAEGKIGKPDVGGESVELNHELFWAVDSKKEGGRV